MKISVTTNDGEVVKIWKNKDIGDLSKTLPRAQFFHDLQTAVTIARAKDKSEPRLTDVEIKRMMAVGRTLNLKFADSVTSWLDQAREQKDDLSKDGYQRWLDTCAKAVSISEEEIRKYVEFAANE